MAGKQYAHAIVNWTRHSVHDLGLLVVRCMLGVVFVYHGSQKLFGWFDGPGLAGFTSFLNQLQVPWPAYATVLVAAVEFLGGVGLVLGMWTRIASLLLAATMGVAIALVHRDTFSVQRNGMEYPLTLAVCMLGLAISGPGKISFGRWLSNWKSKRASREGAVLPSTAAPRRSVASPAATSTARATNTNATSELSQPGQEAASIPRSHVQRSTAAPSLSTAPSAEPRPVPTMAPQPPRPTSELMSSSDRSTAVAAANKPAAVGQQSSRSRIMRIDEAEFSVDRDH
jgi:putative oxidoreductase